MIKNSLVVSCVLTSTTISALFGSGWPHVNGPNHDRVSKESIEITWESETPQPNWRVKCNGGFSSFVVGEGIVVTVLPGKIDEEAKEVVVALDKDTGKAIWNTPLGPATYDGGGNSGADGNKGGDGPRATAVIDEGRVYVYGGQFDLYCMDAKNGTILWKQDIQNDFNGDMIKWQNVMSPLIVDDKVLVSGGGKGQAFLAFNKIDGSLVWKSGTGAVSHVTPVLTTIDGMQQVLFMIRSELVSINPDTGKELWSYPFNFSTSMAASPVVWKNMVHISAGYGTGGAGIEVSKRGSKWKVDELWRKRGNRDIASHWSTHIAHEGYLYGLYSFKEYGDGDLKCIDMRTGEINWQEPGFGQGQMIMADQKLFVLTDFGQMKVVSPTPDSYTLLSEATVIDGKCWATPAISDGTLFIRSTTAGVSIDL